MSVSGISARAHRERELYTPSLDCIIAFAFLVLAFFYRHQCFNFATLLACNTALAILFCSANHIAIGVYMFIWDQYVTPNIDSLCALRAYFHHSTLACVHHSFILLAIERYCKIRQITFLKLTVERFVLFFPNGYLILLLVYLFSLQVIW